MLGCSCALCSRWCPTIFGKHKHSQLHACAQRMPTQQADGPFHLGRTVLALGKFPVKLSSSFHVAAALQPDTGRSEFFGANFCSQTSAEASCIHVLPLGKKSTELSYRIFVTTLHRCLSTWTCVPNSWAETNRFSISRKASLPLQFFGLDA